MLLGGICLEAMTTLPWRCPLDKSRKSPRFHMTWEGWMVARPKHGSTSHVDNAANPVAFGFGASDAI